MRILPDRRGFTLVEILIVVSILAILAAIVVPQFSSASDTSRESAVKVTLSRLRLQIELYKQHHNGNWPDLDRFADQMTLATDVAGNTAAPGTAGYPYGPYIHGVPLNPATQSSDVSDGAVGTSAWYYNPATGEFLANHSAAAREY